MKVFCTAAVLALTMISGAASAQTTAVGVGTGVSNSVSGATSSSNPSATAFNIFNSPSSVQERIRQSGSLKTVPNAIAPGLGSAAVETCYGPGVSGGVSVTGFGASFGAGQYDSACNRRLNARTLWAFGAKRVAMRIMANEPEVQQAMVAEGMITPEPGDVSYRGPARTTNYQAQGTASRGAMFNGCKKWSGGATGVGSCVVY